jgi:ATP-dependent DNA helicase RecQ
MRNQIEAAARLGIRAETINSPNNEEWGRVREELESDAVDVLLISPERFNNDGFRDQVLPALATRVGLLVVDEAHCISDWGQRPSGASARTPFPAPWGRPTSR